MRLVPLILDQFNGFVGTVRPKPLSVTTTSHSFGYNRQKVIADLSGICHAQRGEGEPFFLRGIRRALAAANGRGRDHFSFAGIRPRNGSPLQSIIGSASAALVEIVRPHACPAVAV